MKRFLASLLVFTASCGREGGGLAIRLPAADAFAPPGAPRRDAPRRRTPSSERAGKRPLPARRGGDPGATSTSLYAAEGDGEQSMPPSPSLGRRYLIPATGAVSLSLVSLAALAQRLPGPPIDATAPPPFWTTLPFGVAFSGSYGPYTPSLVMQDAGATVLCLAGAALFVKAITYSAKVGALESRDSRKIIHTLSAPLFVLLWPLYTHAAGARVFATIVPLLNAVRLVLAGTGGGGGSEASASESELADAISRSGKADEALGGPFIYVMALMISTLLFWTDSPVGVVSIATLAVGDGLADLVGRRYGSTNKWPFNGSKSVAGSAAFVAGSFAGSYGLLSWLTSTGSMDALDVSPSGLAVRLLVIALVSAAAELVPAVDDNYSVPLSAAAMAALLLN